MRLLDNIITMLLKVAIIVALAAMMVGVVLLASVVGQLIFTDAIECRVLSIFNI